MKVGDRCKTVLEVGAALDRLDAGFQLLHQRGRAGCLLRLPAVLILSRSMLLPCHGQVPPVVVSICGGAGLGATRHLRWGNRVSGGSGDVSRDRKSVV